MSQKFKDYGHYLFVMISTCWCCYFIIVVYLKLSLRQLLEVQLGASKPLLRRLGRKTCKLFFLAYAILSCNTASLLLGHVKVIVLNQLREKEQFREYVPMFSQIDALKEEIKAAGEVALCIFYM